MTFFWIACIWTVAGLPLGILAGSTIANLNGEEATQPELDVEMGLEMPVCS